MIQKLMWAVALRRRPSRNLLGFAPAQAGAQSGVTGAPLRRAPYSLRRRRENSPAPIAATPAEIAAAICEKALSPVWTSASLSPDPGLEPSLFAGFVGLSAGFSVDPPSPEPSSSFLY